MNNSLKKLTQCLIQGFTEGFPISSSMHEKFFDLSDSAALHCGTAGAFFLILRRHVWFLFRCLKVKLMINLIIMTLPTIIFGYFIKHQYHISANTMACINIGFALLMLITIFINGKRGVQAMHPFQCLAIGLIITTAFIPGVSRFGVTFTVLRLFMVRKLDALVATLLIGIPITFGAGMLSLLKNEPDFCTMLYSIAAGLITFFMLKITFKMLNHWYVFSIYRILCSIALLLYSI